MQNPGVILCWLSSSHAGLCRSSSPAGALCTLYLMLLSSRSGVSGSLRPHGRQTWCFCPDAPSPDSLRLPPSIPSCLCSNACLAQESPDPSPDTTSPFPAWILYSTHHLPACLTAVFLSCLSLPGARFACHILCYVSGTHRMMVPSGGVGCKEGKPQSFWIGVVFYHWPGYLNPELLAHIFVCML